MTLAESYFVKHLPLLGVGRSCHWMWPVATISSRQPLEAKGFSNMGFAVLLSGLFKRLGTSQSRGVLYIIARVKGVERL